MDINVNSAQNFFKNMPSFQPETLSEAAKTPALQSVSRLNDLDNNILEQKAYGDLEDKMLKMECRIENVEDLLNKVLEEIRVSTDLGETAELDILNMKKNQLEVELIQLNKEYAKLDLSSKLSGQIASFVGKPRRKRSGIMEKLKNEFSEKIFSKISKRFEFLQNIKKSLNRLSSINSNVDELVTMKTPHGEAKERYRKLTSYINRANVIQYDITKKVSEFKN